MCFHILAKALSIIVKMIEEKSMQQAIIGFHLDDEQDWVMTAAGRQEKLGMMLQCKKCALSK